MYKIGVKTAVKSDIIPNGINPFKTLKSIWILLKIIPKENSLKNEKLENENNKKEVMEMETKAPNTP